METIDAALVAVAEGQHGMFTTEQARDLGTGVLTLGRLVGSRALRHPARGLYAVTALVDESPEGWHRHLSAGAHLVYDDAVLTGVSAVLAHGLPVWGADLARPAIHRPIDRAVGVKAFRLRPRPATPGRPGAVETDLGPADDVPTSVVQLAIDAGTLPGVVSADAALRLGRTDEASLAAAVTLVATWPRSGRAKAMLALVDGCSESPGESRCRVELLTHGIEVTSQFEVRDSGGRLVGRADFRVDGTNVLVEFDGRVKYDSGDPAVLWQEKKREDRMRALGWVLVRVTWADLERPGAVVAKVRRAIRSAA